VNPAFNPTAYYRPGSLASEPTSPFGAKGAGEGTMVGVAPAVANAIYDAIGARMKELCITPEKILEALDRIGVASS
jgi:CO/xanthine dehydrogenase Mo-binding subunit